MTWRLSVEAEAELDIAVAAEWYETERPGLGYEFLGAVRECLGAIERTPLQYREIWPGVRRAFLRRFPYLVYFVVDGDDLKERHSCKRQLRLATVATDLVVGHDILNQQRPIGLSAKDQAVAVVEPCFVPDLRRENRLHAPS